jgi:hypothetical protein
MSARDIPMRDCYGQELEVGQIVAYNMSGSVVRGKIVKAEIGSPIHIEVLTNASLGGNLPFVKAGHVSKIKQPTSILVLPNACPHCGQNPIWTS